MTNANTLPIVVTGGSGFLGQNVVQYFLEKGYQCGIVDNKTPTVPFLQRAVEQKKLDVVLTDLMDPAAVQAAGKKLPAKFHLVHLAAVIETTTEVGAQTRKTLDFHSGISMNIVDGWAGQIASICYISSWEVYGNPKRLPLDETHELDPFNVYGVGKLMTEGYLRVSCQSLGIPLTILRLPHIYGPGEWHNKALPNFIKNCIAGRPHKLFGGGKDLRQFVHARDVAYAIRLSLGRSSEGIFNIAGRESLNVRQLLNLVQNLMGTRLPVEELPADRPPLDLSFDLTHARQGLGYEPQVSLEEGVRGEIEWFLSTEKKRR
jgi:UDP-glucose 4-epimerase